MLSAAIAAALLLGPGALANGPVKLSSVIDVKGVIQSIKQYSTPGVWGKDDYQTVSETLSKSIPYDPIIYCNETSSSDPGCTVSTYSVAAIKYAVANCTAITVNGISVPGNTTLDLTGTKPNTVITFQGNTSWQFALADYNMLAFSGVNLTVQGAAGSVLDGNGAAWWDGIGSNGGITKPDHMITGSKLTGYSLFKNLYIKNAPTHVFSLSNNDHLYMAGIVIDMKDGHKILPNGLEAAHNTDGYDLSTTTNSILTNNVVFNEDDCVAITSGVNVNVSNFYCDGSHGLSIGSVGGKSNNTVSQVTFRDSTIVNSQNGCRIKANSNTTGSVDRVTYDNIHMSNISIYGIDVQQDYLNGGPTGNPTPGVNITNIVMRNIYGTVLPNATNYYILVATPYTTAASWTFENVSITGGNASCDSTPPNFVCT